MTPHQMYQADLAAHRIVYDPVQADVIEKLDQLYHELINKPSQNILVKLKRKINNLSKPHLKGIYFWGGVGIGKTYLMDIFYHSLPFSQKRRVHFHAFMLEVHQALRDLQGTVDPLSKITKELAKNIRVLCLDEFMVEDIADAMLLAGLLKGLFDHGVCLVMTSNTQPQDLYRHGLQRSRFLPAIAQIKQEMCVVHLSSDVDYRLRILENKGVYFTPLNESSQQALHDYFEQFSMHEKWHTDPILINHRLISIIKRSHNIIWFDFKVICSSPRSQADYLAIAKDYNLVILSGVTILSDEQLSELSYFIKLIDVFYDYHVKLIISAEVPVEKLYVAGHLEKEFQRTKSRLIEMQMQWYWESVSNH